MPGSSTTWKLRIAETDSQLALEAGEMKKEHCNSLRQPNRRGIAFRKVEEEMKPVVKKLRRLGTIFLDEI